MINVVREGTGKADLRQAGNDTTSPTTTAIELICDDDADELFGCSKVTRRRWRLRGEGPPFVKLGRRVFYRRDAVAHWLTDQEVRSSAEHALRLKARRAGRIL